MPKRSRVALRPHGFLVVAIAANCVAGIWYSPLTSLTKVRVSGAEKFDENRIRRFFQEREGVPALQVSGRSVESDALQGLEVEDADFSRNVFGRGQLKLGSRIPVARVVRGQGVTTSNLALSQNGYFYASRQNLDTLPVLSLLSGQEAASLGVTTMAPTVQLSELCQKIPGQIDLSKCVALYKPDRGLCLNILEPQTLIVLGSSDHLDEKLKALVDLLSLGPQVLDQNEEINLMAPSKHPGVPRVSLKGKQ